MSYVEESMAKLNEAGYKYTKRRADMLAIFANETHFIKAKTVQERMADLYPGMSFDTVYRNLRLFVDYNLIETSEVNGERVFRQHCNPEMGHHHHFICRNCGKTVPLKMCPLDYFTDQLPGYKIEGHTFELQGLCADCQENS